MRDFEKHKLIAGTLGGGSLVAGAIALAIPMIERWEGTRLNPYRDIVGVMTVCTGETRAEMRHYTREECRTLLEKAVRSDYSAAVLKCVPALRHKPYALAASISLAYNIGIAAYCRSTAAREFNAGQWLKGCDAFSAWVNAGGKRVQGLVNRRADERALCRRDAA
jgi:lysozyme